MTRTRGRPPKQIEGDLLAAAAREFLANGYVAANIDDIAAAAGTTKPTLYRRFSSKQALFEATVVHLAQGLAPKLQALTEDRRPPAEVLLELGWLFHRHQHSAKTLALTRLIIAEGERCPNEIASVRDQLIGSHLGPFIDYLELLQREGVLHMPDSREAAINFSIMAGGGFRSLLGVRTDRRRTQERLEQLVRFFLAGYAPPPARR